MAKCAMGRQCLELMARKRTNLAVAVDVPTAAEMLSIADQARDACWRSTSTAALRGLCRVVHCFLSFGRIWLPSGGNMSGSLGLLTSSIQSIQPHNYGALFLGARNHFRFGCGLGLDSAPLRAGGAVHLRIEDARRHF